MPGAHADRSVAGGLRERDDLDQVSFAHDRGIRHPQDAFEGRQYVLARDRAGRRERHVALHARVDQDVELEHVAEQRLGNGLDLRALEIHFHALTDEHSTRLRRGDARV